MSKPIAGAGSDTDLIQCPYEISHMIMRKRFQVHLVRCRKSHPNAQKVTCPFNVTHRVNKVELEWHVMTCVERQYFEDFCNGSAQIVGLTSSIDRTFCDAESVMANGTFNMTTDFTPVGGEYVDDDDNDDLETWSTDTHVPTYNPREHAKKADVLRMPVGLTPSQRNAFRLAERKRLQSLAK